MKIAKNIYFILACLFLSITAMNAQRFVLIDVNRILENMDDYKKAQQELDQVAATWKQEIQQEYDKIKVMYNKYQAEQVIMSEEARQQREEEIMNQEKSVRELQRKRFGEEGMLFLKRQELVRPLQDKVYGAIQEYADARGYDAVFDTSGAAGVIFYNKELDKTDDILKRVQNR